MVFDKSKQLKKLSVVLFGNAHARVYDGYFQELLPKNLFDLNSCFNFASLSELKSVGLKTKENLYDSLLVTANHMAAFIF